jgi:aprataxin
MIMEEIAKLGYEVADQHNDSDLIKVGVHSIPSLSNLHIHFITKDLSSEKMKRKHHFNSFATKFFVNFEDLPLKDGDSRLSVKEMEHVCNKSDMICPFCGKNFTNRFAELKKHLQKTEFQKIFIEKKNKSVELIEID